MSRVVRALVGAVLLSALLLTPASAQSTLPSFGTVVIVLAPYLTWDDIDPAATPALWEMADVAALANATVRSGSLDPAPDALFGAAVLAAGRPVRVTADGPALAESLLGSAVRGAGGRTAAIGSSAADVADALSPGSAHAAIVARDAEGSVDLAETTARVLRSSDAAAGDITTDLDVLETAYRDVLAVPAGSEGMPCLVVLDPGDAVRVHEAGNPAMRRAARPGAVTVTDAVVRIALRSLPADGMLVVVSTAQAPDDGPAGYGPVLVYGAGPGLLHSPGTRTDGLVTLPDVTVTVLEALNVNQSGAMTGSTVILVEEDSARDARLAMVTEADATARALEATRVPLWVVTIAFAVLLLGLAATSAVRGQATSEVRAQAIPLVARRLIAYALAGLCAVPAASLLAQVGGGPSTVQDAWVRFAIALAVIVAVTAWRAGRRVPVAMLGYTAVFTAALVIFDQLAGGSLARGSAFSYSPLFGVRFYGLGNEGAAVLVGAVLVAVALRIDRYGASRTRELLWFGMTAVLVAVVPFLGANVGVAAWGTAALVAAYLYASGRRLTVRILVLVLVAVASVVGLAALIDTLGSGSSHLGRVLGDSAGLLPMLGRKLALSGGILVATPLVVLLPVALGALVYLLFRPTGALGAVITRRRGIASSLAGGIAAAVAGVLTEDSGVALSAIVMLMPAAAFAIAAVHPEEEA